MIDAGLELEKSAIRVVDRLKNSVPDQWSEHDTQILKGLPKKDDSGLVDKLHFGSDYAYRDADSLLHLRRKNVGIKASLARGGLSTVWGSAMLPATDHDTRTWPIRYADLERHYKAVSGFIPFSGCADELLYDFPLGSDTPLDLQPSRQAAYLLQRTAAKKLGLQVAGLHVGRSRVAIKGQGDDEDGCVYCGFCMYGCPYGYIYNSASSLPSLRKTGRFYEETNCIVTQLLPKGSMVEVQGFNRVTHKPFIMRANRVFLAGGTLSTTKLLMQTLDIYEQEHML
jgi:choline dehydrogenase-like flavoprotein